MKRSLLIFPLLAILAGCGGGSSISQPKGQVSVSVVWPATSRVIPSAAQSIVVQIASKSAGTFTGVLTRANPTWTSAAIPALDYTVSANAYLTKDGSGYVIATGNSPVTVTDGGTSNVTLTLASTATQLLLTAASNQLYSNDAIATKFTLKDASGNSLLVPATSLTWKCSDSSVATVDGTGVVTGVKSGTVQITATYSDVDTSLGQAAITSAPLTYTLVDPTGTIGLTINQKR